MNELLLKFKKTIVHNYKACSKCFRGILMPVLHPVFERPVFVVGCSRSGTTVVYNILGMAPELASMHKESHDFWNFLHPLSENNWDSHSLTDNDVSDRDNYEVRKFFFRHLGAKRFVDKANQNCFRIRYLHTIFPDALFVYVKRDGRDNINSMIHGWGRPNEYGTWSKYLPATVEIDHGVYTRWCFFLFDDWRSFTTKPIEEVCAAQWIAANKAAMIGREVIPQNQWVEIVYEDILVKPVETFERVFARLDLRFTEDIRRHCENLASKPYNAFSRPRLDKWKEENPERIGRVLPMISSMMETLGFGT